MNDKSFSHIKASEGAISSLVIMPETQYLAKSIAEIHLKNITTFDTTHNGIGYTGMYGDKKITVLSSGLGNASVGMYTYELFNFHNVERIIKIGIASALDESHKIDDILLTTEVWSESNYASKQGLNSKFTKSSDVLNLQIKNNAEKILFNKVIPARVDSTDIIYKKFSRNITKLTKVLKCSAVEVGSLALFVNAIILDKHASSLLLIIDKLNVKDRALISNTNFKKMIFLALEAI